MAEKWTESEKWTLPEQWRPKRPLFAFHEDSNANATLITPEGKIYAVAEERLTRKRFQGGFPKSALEWIEQVSGYKLKDSPTLVFGNRTHFLPRILGSYFPSFEHDFFGITHKLMLLFHHMCFRFPAFSGFLHLFNKTILKLKFGGDIQIKDHHFAHAASAYYSSGQTSACAISVDNYGDGFAAKVFDCEGTKIRFMYGNSALNSPGQFYGEIAQIAGIAPLLAGKLTGMAASGTPVAEKEMSELFDASADGKSFSSTFSWGRSASSPPFSGFKAIDKSDLAASAQRQFENALIKYVKKAARESGRRNLVLAGGCFANVRLNQMALELPEVDSVYIHPAMSDQGISMGAALVHIATENSPLPFEFTNLLLGPEPSIDHIKSTLEKFGLPFTKPENLELDVAKILAAGKIVARFSGPMEYGLRALGNRSVLYQTTDPDLQSKLNAKFQRAHYMPFAPMTMEPFASKCYVDYEKAKQAARFMTIAFYATDYMKKSSPGVVHIDGTVRPQVLRQSDNPKMYKILEHYHEITGIPSLLNTSFNMHSEPIVGTPEDACTAFEKAGIDHLIAGPFLVSQRK